ncbi:MAG TPA: 50S ribosomal protein L40e [Candidatus Nanoarchaeia archaeon]|nr:50S ribosomal protein L40e [Candidatus Nanoarchaeia archaeon]
MSKFPEASARLFKNIFVCRRCKSKMKTTSQRVLQKMVICKKCGCKAFRAIKKGK